MKQNRLARIEIVQVQYHKKNVIHLEKVDIANGVITFKGTNNANFAKLIKFRFFFI